MPDEINYSVVSYLLRIARNVILSEYKTMQKVIEMGDEVEAIVDRRFDVDEEYELYDRLNYHLKKQSGVCRTLFKKLEQTRNMSELAEEMGYKNSMGASQQKKRCLDQLEKYLWKEEPELAEMLTKRRTKDE